jgi:serine/threonine-protein kinase
LEATHAAGGVHRDVKGANVLVRLEDGRAFLTDFGSAHYRGASRLTSQTFPPGTPAYRSPEAFRFAAQTPASTYAPGPADDLFALGVTAYRLVTGQYPPSADPQEEESRVWATEGPGPRPAREVNTHCGPELSALVSRMLSLHPEARGSVGSLAEALEQAARDAGPEADAPLFHRKTPRPEAEAAPSRNHSRTSRRSWRPGLAAAVALGAAWVLSTSDREQAGQVRVAEWVDAGDGGAVAAGDAALTAPVASTHAPFEGSPIALDMPSKPFRGQLRPDAKGRCPRPTMVPINGGCWLEVNVKLETCREYAYVYKGLCYEPAAPLLPPATSSPAKCPDGR